MNRKVLLVFLIFCQFTLWGKEQIRIACIGNSITYGAAIENRELNCYPAQLASMLGDGYNVKNFGVSVV